jgi:hypothetical protein
VLIILFARRIHFSIKGISNYIHSAYGAVPIPTDFRSNIPYFSPTPLQMYWMTLSMSLTPVLQEEELRCSGDPKFSHLSDDLHIEITAFAPPAEAHARIAYALAEVRRFLVPVSNALWSCTGRYSLSSTALYRVRCGWLIICCSDLELILQSRRGLHPNYSVRRKRFKPQRQTQLCGALWPTACEEFEVRSMHRERLLKCYAHNLRIVSIFCSLDWHCASN